MKNNDEEPIDTIDGGTDCKTDSECADGYHCVNGRCVKKSTTLPPLNPPPIPPTVT